MLRITARDGTTQEIAPGAVSTGLVEASSYQFRTTSRDITLLIDDLPLNCSAEGTFEWQPSFYAGRVRVDTCDTSRQVVGTYFLDVGPTDAKVGSQLFERMVEELCAYRPELLLGTEEATRDVGHQGKHWNPEIGYARLRGHGHSCVDALKAIGRSPLLRLQHERRTVLPHQARRVDLTSVRGLCRSPAIAMVQGFADAQTSVQTTINIPATAESVDNPANRAMAAVLDRLLSRASALAEVFQRRALNAADDDSRKAHRRIEIVTQLQTALKAIRRSPTFASVYRPEITAEGLNAISAHPAYAMAYSRAWYVLRDGASTSGFDQAPVSPTWEVFERWCFLQTTKELEKLLPSAKWTTAQRSGADDSIRVTGITETLRIDVHLQAQFRAWDIAGEDGFRSLSGERSPDIVVTLRSESRRHMLVLDAKYRSKRENILDAMQSAHTYKDSLLWGDIRPWRSLLLIPRGGDATWLEDPAFHDRFGVGCIEVRDSSDLTVLRALLTRFLALEAEI